MTRLGRQIRSTVSKNNILQSLNYRGGFAPPTSRCRDFFLLDHNGQTRIYRLVSGSFNVPLRRKHDSPMEEEDCAPLALIRVNKNIYL